MTDLAPSAIKGDTLLYPSSGAVFGVAFPWMASPPSYTDLPGYWSPRRDWVLSNTPRKEDMWAAAVAIACTKFAAHGYVVKDSNDSARKVSASQQLLKNDFGKRLTKPMGAGCGLAPSSLLVMQGFIWPKRVTTPTAIAGYCISELSPMD